MRIKLSLAGAAAALVLAGCGATEPPATPAACLVPGTEYLRALEAAPGEVRLPDNTPISSCLVPDQASGALQTVGKSIIDAATELNRQILRDPDPRTIIRLGYLVGAVQEGASGTGGVHHDLILRLDSAARYSGPAGKPFGAAFERTFGQGYAAGQADG
ncbi:MAG: hypothetical protein QOI10_1835 [Solirubrobacterales bacterium]|nr:hypothetical protein [Solirubrobacterales bacterium]